MRKKSKRNRKKLQISLIYLLKPYLSIFCAYGKVFDLFAGCWIFLLIVTVFFFNHGSRCYLPYLTHFNLNGVFLFCHFWEKL